MITAGADTMASGVVHIKGLKWATKYFFFFIFQNTGDGSRDFFSWKGETLKLHKSIITMILTVYL